MRLPMTAEHSALVREVGPYIRDRKLIHEAPKEMIPKFERLMILNKEHSEKRRELALMGEI